MASEGGVLGEVIGWSLRNFSVEFPTLVARMREAGIDPELARKLSPRSAFSRACRKLAEKRVIRKVHEEDEKLVFQFTREVFSHGEYEYYKESFLRLDKKTGVLSGDLGELVDRAQHELDQALGQRNGGDVSQIIEAVFQEQESKVHSGLWPIQGGVYLVLGPALPAVQKVDALLKSLGQSLKRFQIRRGEGTSGTELSVRDVLKRGLEKCITEYRSRIAELGESTRDSTLERWADKVQEAQFKLEAHKELLAAESEHLEAELAKCREELRAKVEELTSSKDGAGKSKKEETVGAV